MLDRGWEISCSSAVLESNVVKAIASESFAIKDLRKPSFDLTLKKVMTPMPVEMTKSFLLSCHLVFNKRITF